MPAFREDSELLVTKTAFPLLTRPKGLVGRQGEAEQRDREVGQATPEKKVLGRRWPSSGTGVDPIQMPKPLPSHRARHAFGPK